MLLKYLLIVGCVLMSGDAVVFGDSAEYSYEEQRCLLLGGICAESQECAYNNRLPNFSALCNAGYVCCNSVPRSTTCHLNGGECFAIGTSNCPEKLTVTGVTDCKEGQTCCILI